MRTAEHSKLARTGVEERCREIGGRALPCGLTRLPAGIRVPVRGSGRAFLRSAGRRKTGNGRRGAQATVRGGGTGGVAAIREAGTIGSVKPASARWAAAHAGVAGCSVSQRISLVSRSMETGRVERGDPLFSSGFSADAIAWHSGQGCWPSNVLRRPSETPDCADYEIAMPVHAMTWRNPRPPPQRCTHPIRMSRDWKKRRMNEGF